MADFAVGQSRMLYGATMQSERPAHRMSEQWHPLGPVGVITAFNFPVAVWAWNAFVAAIAGDTVIWKPSPKAPLCAVAVQQICNRVMQQQGYAGIFSLFITDQPALADNMVQDPRLPLISFTGSVPVGRRVAAAVGQRLGRTLLELSGNNAVIVDETADLDMAVRAIVFGAVGTAGQRCTTTRRLIVHESRCEELDRQTREGLCASADRQSSRQRCAHGAAHRPGGGGRLSRCDGRNKKRGRRDSLRWPRPESAGLFRRAHDRAGTEPLACRAARNLCTDSVCHDLPDDR